jgi:hypothetical protein
MWKGYFDAGVALFRRQVEYISPIGKQRDRKNAIRVAEVLDNPATVGVFGHLGFAHSVSFRRELEKEGVISKALYLDKTKPTYYANALIAANRRATDIDRPISDLEWYKLSLTHSFQTIAMNALRISDSDQEGIQIATKIGYEAVKKFTTMQDIRDFEQRLILFRDEGELSTVPLTEILAGIPLYMENVRIRSAT